MTPPMTDVAAICAADMVKRLRVLLAEASPQPWVYRPSKYDDWGWIRGVEQDSDIGRYRPIVANAKNSNVHDEEMNAHRKAGTDPYGPNALLIVEAVNALPALLDTIERQAAALTRMAAEPGEDFWNLARVAFALEVSAIDRDARLSDLTADEIDSIIHAIISLPALRSALMKDKAL